MGKDAIKEVTVEAEEEKEIIGVVEVFEQPLHGATSFEELEEIEATEDALFEVSHATRQLPVLVSNVIEEAETPQERDGMLQKLFDGFINLARDAFGMVGKSLKDIAEGGGGVTPEFASSITVFKNADGRWSWLARYSNNTLDNDYPPDIISSKSHKRFDELLDKGIFPMPELWVWHEKSLKVGDAIWHTYDKENGIAMAAGFFDKESDHIAETINKSTTHWGTSHGMVDIKRDMDDSKIIVEHQTIEISVLPADKAANKLADFETFSKELDMAIDEKKREDLQNSLGIDSAVLEEIQARNTVISDKADDMNLERKEADPVSDEPAVEEEPAAEEVVEPKVEEEVESEPAEEVAVEEEAESKPVAETAFSEDQAEELKSLFQLSTTAILETVQKQLSETLDPLTKIAEDMQKEDSEKIKEKVDNLPQSALFDAVGGMARGLSATEAKETKVDGRTKEGRKKPTEEIVIGGALAPVLNDLLSGNVLEN